MKQAHITCSGEATPVLRFSGADVFMLVGVPTSRESTAVDQPLVKILSRAKLGKRNILKM